MKYSHSTTSSWLCLLLSGLSTNHSDNPRFGRPRQFITFSLSYHKLLKPWQPTCPRWVHVGCRPSPGRRRSALVCKKGPGHTPARHHWSEIKHDTKGSKKSQGDYGAFIWYRVVRGEGDEVNGGLLSHRLPQYILLPRQIFYQKTLTLRTMLASIQFSKQQTVVSGGKYQP